MLRLEIPRELKSPNRWQGRHWRYKHRETHEWEQAVWCAMLQQRPDMLRVPPIKALAMIFRGEPVFGCREERRVVVTRECPSRRNFVKDEDNLRFSVKPLNDALKRLGLIRDDSRKWLEQPMPTQEVSADGRWRTGDLTWTPPSAWRL